MAKLHELTPDASNANKGTERGRYALEASLRKYGAGRSILIDKHGRIIAGNKTAESAADVGIDDVIVVQTDGRQLVAVQRTDLDLDDKAARELAYADNRVAELDLSFDAEQIMADLQAGVDLSAFWRKDELDELLADLTPKTTGDTEAQVDRAEELREKWQTAAGQMWQLGEHRLVCGDCTDAATVARVLQGDKPKLMITDPPYGVEYDADWRNDAAEKGLISYAASRVGKVENDDRADWTEAWRLFPGDVVYCWHADRRASIVEQNLSTAGFEIRCQIVWVKPNAPISRGHYRWGHEACWYAVRKGGNADWIGDHAQTTAWEGATDKNAEGGHSTQKPVWLMEKSIANHNGDVYEPFSGSGTTIIACENLSRRCRAVEISPAYVAVALQRYLDHCGKTPVLIG